MANYIAIDLDSQGLYAVAGSAARSGAKVTHALAWNGDEPPPPLTPDTAKAVGEGLRDRLKAAGVAPAPVLVAVGRDRIIPKELRFPPVPPTDEPALVRFQAMKEMTESPDEIVLDYVPLGEANGERRAMAVVVRKELFGAIKAMCEAAGLKLAGVTPRPYAVAAGLVRAQAGGLAAGEAVVALTATPGGGEFAVVRDGAVTYTLALPAPVVANEAMLVAQVRRNLAVYAGQNPGAPVQAVYVAEVDGPVAGRLRAALGVPVHAYDPLAGSVPAVPSALRGRFAGASGLLAGRGANALPINFASPRQPVVDKDPARRKLAIMALVAAILLVVGAAGGFWLVGEADAEVARLTEERDQLKEAVGKGGPDAARMKGIDGWSKRGVVWLDELQDLADRMPADDGVRVSSFSGIPIAPGKDGKQEAQARLELKLAVASTTAANALVSAFERDNSGANKYYVGTSQTVGGTNPGGGRHNQAVTLVTKVNHREPNQYTRVPRFSPPKRMGGGVGPAPEAPPAAETTAETAPPPREKPDPAAELTADEMP